MHEGEGGGFQENEEETEDKETPQAHFLDTFVILQHHNGSRSMMTRGSGGKDCLARCQG